MITMCIFVFMSATGIPDAYHCTRETPLSADSYERACGEVDGCKYRRTTKSLVLFVRQK